MFPHVPGGQPRGDERLAWVSFGTLNGGLALRAIGEPLAMLPLAGLLVFVLLAWPRVRALSARH